MNRDDATILSVRLSELLPRHPSLAVTGAMALLGCAWPVASRAIRVLEDAGIVRALEDGKKRNCAVVFGDYLALLRPRTVRAGCSDVEPAVYGIRRARCARWVGTGSAGIAGSGRDRRSDATEAPISRVCGAGVKWWS